MNIYIILEKPSNISKYHHFDEILCNFADNSNKLWREVFPDGHGALIAKGSFARVFLDVIL